MAATVTELPSSRANQTAVRFPKRVQPNSEGGRPTDPLVLAFEGDLEGLVATQNDADAMVQGLDLLFRYDSIATMQQAKALVATSDAADKARARNLRTIKVRLICHLQARARRLQTHVIPGLQEIVSTVDAALTQRAHLELVR